MGGPGPNNRRRASPWLVFFSQLERDKSEQQQVHLVNLAEEKTHSKGIEGVRRSICYGCNGPWAFMVDRAHTTCFLLDVTSMKKIPLLAPLPRSFVGNLASCILTLSPSHTNSVNIIICCHSTKPLIILYSLLENRWTQVKYEVRDLQRDRIFQMQLCDGKIYGLTNRDTLAEIDIVGSSSSPSVRVRPLPMESPNVPIVPINMAFTTMLVESCRGRGLYLVFRLQRRFTNWMYGFQVCKMDFTEMKWVNVASLGDDCAFFLCQSTLGISCSASKVAGVRSDCIYYADMDEGTVCSFDMVDHSVSLEMSLPNNQWDNSMWFIVSDPKSSQLAGKVKKEILA